MCDSFWSKLKSAFGDSDVFDDDFVNLDQISCNYYDVPKFNKYVKLGNNLSLLSLNIRSIVKHFDDLKIFLQSIDIEFDFIILTETWLNDNNKDLYNLSGYKGYHYIRNGRAGGVSIYCREKYKCKTIKFDINIKSNLEFIFVEINSNIPKKNNSDSLVIGGVYRPPGTRCIDLELKELDFLLQKCNSKSSNSIITGDFNIDLINLSCSKNKDYIDLMFSHNSYPVITKPTRPPPLTNTVSSPTLLDHIWTSVPSVFNSGIFDVHISDHLPSFTYFKDFINMSDSNMSYQIRFRDFSIENKNYFIDSIREVDWAAYINVDSDVNCNTDVFTGIIKNIYETCFPVCTKIFGYKRLKNPWITSALLSSIEECHRLLKLVKNNYCSFEYYKLY